MQRQVWELWRSLEETQSTCRLKDLWGTKGTQTQAVASLHFPAVLQVLRQDKVVAGAQHN